VFGRRPVGDLVVDEPREPMQNLLDDGVVAGQLLEQVQLDQLDALTGDSDDRLALARSTACSGRGGTAAVTVPFRAGRSRGGDEEPFQRVYSPETVAGSFVDPSGLRLRAALVYGERLPFYALTVGSPAGWTGPGARWTPR
jgi:hypothetical protein